MVGCERDEVVPRHGKPLWSKNDLVMCRIANSPKDFGFAAVVVVEPAWAKAVIVCGFVNNIFLAIPFYAHVNGHAYIVGTMANRGKDVEAGMEGEPAVFRVVVAGNLREG